MVDGELLDVFARAEIGRTLDSEGSAVAEFRQDDLAMNPQGGTLLASLLHRLDGECRGGLVGRFEVDGKQQARRADLAAVQQCAKFFDIGPAESQGREV